MAFSNSVKRAKRNKMLMSPSIAGFKDSIVDAKLARCYKRSSSFISQHTYQTEDFVSFFDNHTAR